MDKNLKIRVEAANEIIRRGSKASKVPSAFRQDLKDLSVKFEAMAKLSPDNSDKLLRLRNEAVSLAQGLATQDAALADWNEFMKVCAAHVRKYYSAATEAKKAKKAAKQETAGLLSQNDLLALASGESDAVPKDIITPAMRKSLTKFGKYADLLPKKGDKSRPAFKVLRMPVIPMSTRFADVKKLGRLGGVDLDGRYYVIQNQLIVAINTGPESGAESESESEGKSPEMLRDARKMIKQNMDSQRDEDFARVTVDLEKQAAKEKWKPVQLQRELRNAESRLATEYKQKYADAVASMEADTGGGVAKKKDTVKRANLDTVVKAISDKLGHRFSEMPGIAKYRNSGYVYYWVTDDRTLTVLQSAYAGGQSGIDGWGFPFD